MSKAVAKQPVNSIATISADALAKLILHGDLKALTPTQKVEYYSKVCDIIGLNPLTKPFSYNTMNGKEVLYADKGCAEQLRKIHSVSLKTGETKIFEDIYTVVVEASTPDGRHDSALAAVSVKGLSGEARANAFMKCETKAKRRATLSICGLNMLDESELANAHIDHTPEQPPAKQPDIVLPPKEESKTEKPKATGPSRGEVGKEIVALQKLMKVSDVELAEWAQNKFGKNDLKTLTIAEMIDFRNELQNEAKGK